MAELVDNRTASRRVFLAVAWVSGVGIALAACAPSAAPQPAEAPKPPTPAGAASGAAPSAAQPTAPTAPKPAPTAPPTESVERTAPAKAPAKLIPVKVGLSSPEITKTAIYLAKEKGFDKEGGIDLEIQHFQTAEVAIKGMLASGEPPIISGSNISLTIVMRSQGAPIKHIGLSTLAAPFSLAARADRNINSIKDLVGKTIGISVPGTLADTLVRALIAKEGLDPNRADQFTYVQVGGNADRFRALQAGKVDATLMSWGDLRLLEQDKNLKVLANPLDALPEYVLDGTLTTDQVIKERPEIPYGYIFAQTKGARYCAAHREEAIAVGAKMLGQAPENLAGAYDMISKLWAVNGNCSRQQAEYMQSFNLQFKLQDKAVPIDDTVTWEFSDKVVAALGKA